MKKFHEKQLDSFEKGTRVEMTVMREGVSGVGYITGTILDGNFETLKVVDDEGILHVHHSLMWHKSDIPQLRDTEELLEPWKIAEDFNFELEEYGYSMNLEGFMVEFYNKAA